MLMIRCMIVDDEKPARDELRFLLESFEDIVVVKEAENGRQAYDFHKECPVDLVFLDINMPQITGDRVAERWLKQKCSPQIVFTTAYDEHAIKAFDLNVTDYLLKPIGFERLERAVRRIRFRMETQLGQKILEHSGGKKKTMEYSGKICLETHGKLIPIPVEDIIYATVSEKQTWIYTKKGRFAYNYSLTHLEERLGQGIFLRTHRAYLVNTDCVESIEPWFHNTYRIVLKGGEEKIPVSRNHVKAFKDTFRI